MNVPLAKCYGSSCTCAKGYVYDQIKKLCQLQNIAVPASDVHCDLAHGSQCGFNAKCIYDPGINISNENRNFFRNYLENFKTFPN